MLRLLNLVVNLTYVVDEIADPDTQNPLDL